MSVPPGSDYLCTVNQCCPVLQSLHIADNIFPGELSCIGLGEVLEYLHSSVCTIHTLDLSSSTAPHDPGDVCSIAHVLKLCWVRKTPRMLNATIVCSKEISEDAYACFADAASNGQVTFIAARARGPKSLDHYDFTDGDEDGEY